MVDGSIVRVHQHGAPEKIKQDGEAVGKPRGGLSTKILAAIDSQGNPIRLLITAGQASEYEKFIALIKNFSADYVLAEKETTAEPVLPSRKNRLEQRDHDKKLYKERNLVELLFQKIKPFRRIATHYDRPGRHYQAMLSLVASIIWLA